MVSPLHSPSPRVLFFEGRVEGKQKKERDHEEKKISRPIPSTVEQNQPGQKEIATDTWENRVDRMGEEIRKKHETRILTKTWGWYIPRSSFPLVAPENNTRLEGLFCLPLVFASGFVEDVFLAVDRQNTVLKRALPVRHDRK